MDLLIQYGHQFLPVEVKSAATFHDTFASGFGKLPADLPRHPHSAIVVYSGDANQPVGNTRLTNPWKLSEVLSGAG